MSIFHSYEQIYYYQSSLHNYDGKWYLIFLPISSHCRMAESVPRTRLAIRVCRPCPKSSSPFRSLIGCADAWANLTAAAATPCGLSSKAFISG